MGAAWATLLTEAAYFAMTAAALAAYGHNAGWLRLLLRPALATAVFTLVLWLGRGLPLLVSSVLASLAFAATTFALGVWDAKERELMRGLLRGSSPGAGGFVG